MANLPPSSDTAGFIEALSHEHGVLDRVDFFAGKGGLPAVRLTAPGSSAEIYFNGACVTSWTPAAESAGGDALFVSKTSPFVAGKAIRGGVPIIFPWFGPCPHDSKLPQHGFARNTHWNFVSCLTADLFSQITFGLDSNLQTQQMWPHDFSMRFTVAVSSVLTMDLVVTNRGTETISFDEALHTYFSVDNVREVAVTGLGNATYIDKTDGFKRKVLPVGELRLAGETDSLFLDVAGPHVLKNRGAGRPDILVTKDKSSSTVVWNPWEGKAEAMAELTGGQWPGFVCVESVNAADNIVRLGAGQSHRMRTLISLA
jgi:glucose-6-phosphate 1-epimerase